MTHYIFAERLECYVALNPEKTTVKKVECPIKQRIGQSEEDYQNACKEIFKATKEKAFGRDASEAIPADDEETVLDETPAAAEALKEDGTAW